MKNDWDFVDSGNASDIVCSSDSSHDRSILVLVLNALPAEVRSAALGHLKDDWGLRSLGCLKRRNDGRARCDIDGRYRELVLLAVFDCSTLV